MSHKVFTSLRLAHAGDIQDYRDIILNGVDDLVDVTQVEAHVSRGGVAHTLAGSVQDASARVVRIDLGTAPTDWLPSGPDDGEWIGQIEVIFGDGTQLTWPAVGSKIGFFSINVVRELG